MLSEIKHEISVLQENGLVINGSVVRFTSYFGADRLRLTVCGMKSANSNFAFIYCEQTKKNYCNGGARKRKHFDPNQPGAAREWLLSSIPVDRIVVDALHMYLRVSDRLGIVSDQT